MTTQITQARGTLQYHMLLLDNLSYQTRALVLRDNVPCGRYRWSAPTVWLSSEILQKRTLQVGDCFSGVLCVPNGTSIFRKNIQEHY